MPVSITVHKRKGKAKPRVKRVVFYYRKNGGVVARSDRKQPYKRTLLIHLAPGPHHVYARVYYTRKGSYEAAQGDREAPVHRLRVAFRG